MINKKESIKKYLNAFLNKKWSIIHDPQIGSDWIIDVKNKNWIIELQKSRHCWYRYVIFYEISELYDMKIFEVEEVIRDWVKEVLKCGGVAIHVIRYGEGRSVEEVLKRGVVARI